MTTDSYSTSNTAMLLNTLPSEIINTIISYTLSPQSRELQNDITSCVETTKQISSYYKEQFPETEDSRGTYEEWISNDIARFLNNDIPTLYGYQDLYLGVYQRWFMNTSKDLDAMRTYITRIDDDLYPNDIKVTIGLLTPAERDNLIAFLDVPSTVCDV